MQSIGTTTTNKKILILHSEYIHKGGEEVYIDSQIALLRKYNHSVKYLSKANANLMGLSPWELLKAGFQSAWNTSIQKSLVEDIISYQPNVIHIHNFFPQWSPSVHHIARKYSIPSIQHLHNYRLGCLNGLLLRNNQVCELCIGKNPWRGVLYKCYKNSLPASFFSWYMLTLNNLRDTWHKEVSCFITLSKFSANKFIEIGLSEHKLKILPNFVNDPLEDGCIPQPPSHPVFIYIGRLAIEKGIFNLLAIWREFRDREWILQIVGDGPLLPDVQAFVAENQIKNIYLLGRQPHNVAIHSITNSSALILPSLWHEGMPLSILECFAVGRPALVSNLGTLPELVEDQVTGFCLPPNNLALWVERLRWCGNNLSQLHNMGCKARETYLEKYTPEVHYRGLMKIYNDVT